MRIKRFVFAFLVCWLGLSAAAAQESGSQLIFLLDSGVNPETLPRGPDFDDSLPVVENFGGNLVRFGNSVTIVNSNPDDAVTLKFQYGNREGRNALSFLAVLPCGSDFTFDPFDFNIPGAPVNVGDRLFGGGQSISGISTREFGDGRFVLALNAVAAAGNETRRGKDTGGGPPDFDDPEDLDSTADLLFPNETPLLVLTAKSLDDCSAVDEDTFGVASGINETNLHVLNASAMSFNFLSGSHREVRGDGGAIEVEARVRRGVDLSGSPSADPSAQRVELLRGVRIQTSLKAIRGSLAPDPPAAPKRAILSGSERIFLGFLRNRDDPNLLPPTFYYLSQDVHGGRVIASGCQGVTLAQPACSNPDDPFLNRVVRSGALGLDSQGEADSQLLFAASFKDDYNGSNDPFAFDFGSSIISADNSYRLDVAASYYRLDGVDGDDDDDGGSKYGLVGFKGLDAFRVAVRDVGDQQVIGGPHRDLVFVERIGLLGLRELLGLAEEDEDEGIRLSRITTRDFFYDFDEPDFAVAPSFDGQLGSYFTIVKRIDLRSGQAGFLAEAGGDDEDDDDD